MGTLIADVKQPILLVAPEGREEETMTRLARVGFDHVLGYLKGSFEAWKSDSKEFDSVDTITADELKTLLQKEEIEIFDVRKESEHFAQHALNSSNTPLDFINSFLNQFPEKGVFYVHCAGGYRSVIAASILKSRGIHNSIDVLGGFKAMQESGIDISAYQCPTTMTA